MLNARKRKRYGHTDLRRVPPHGNNLPPCTAAEPCRAVTNRTVSYRTVLYHTLPYRTLPNRKGGAGCVGKSPEKQQPLILTTVLRSTNSLPLSGGNRYCYQVREVLRLHQNTHLPEVVELESPVVSHVSLDGARIEQPGCAGRIRE